MMLSFLSLLILTWSSHPHFTIIFKVSQTRTQSSKVGMSYSKFWPQFFYFKNTQKPYAYLKGLLTSIRDLLRLFTHLPNVPTYANYPPICLFGLPTHLLSYQDTNLPTRLHNVPTYLGYLPNHLVYLLTYIGYILNFLGYQLTYPPRLLNYLSYLPTYIPT
jgi:hypothetical protein